VNIQERWEIESWISAAVRNKADSYEVHSLRSSVDSLERTVRELSASLTGLQYKL